MKEETTSTTPSTPTPPLSCWPQARFHCRPRVFIVTYMAQQLVDVGVDGSVLAFLSVSEMLQVLQTSARRTLDTENLERIRREKHTWKTIQRDRQREEYRLRRFTLLPRPEGDRLAVGNQPQYNRLEEAHFENQQAEHERLLESRLQLMLRRK